MINSRIPLTFVITVQPYTCTRLIILNNEISNLIPLGLCLLSPLWIVFSIGSQKMELKWVHFTVNFYCGETLRSVLQTPSFIVFKKRWKTDWTPASDRRQLSPPLSASSHGGAQTPSWREDRWAVWPWQDARPWTLCCGQTGPTCVHWRKGGSGHSLSVSKYVADDTFLLSSSCHYASSSRNI